MSKKTVNSDIYNIAGLVHDVEKVYLPDETEETLAAGTYGYIEAIETKRLQTQVMMTGELSNESFPSRARLERNVITHAIMANIEDINAVSAKMNAYIAIRESDILDNINRNNNTFTIDRECPIYFGDYEFHLEYDVILRQIYIPGSNVNAYTAQYDMPRETPYSTISNPYLSAPAVIILNNEAYIYITVVLAQVTHNAEYKKLVTSNVIDNKTINFEFEDQLAYFEVHCIESDEDYYLTPVFEGAGVPEGTTYYCWYQYIDTDLIRVRFDRSSYMPGLNAEIEVLYKTTKGSEGNFSYTEDVYMDLESEQYGYRNITALVTPLSDSTDGKDRKSKKELQALIPKETLARGSLTTITDLNNYFGMLDSDQGRIVIQKKIDNQIERVYYAYLVLKDENMNVIPTNTIDLKISMDQLVESQIFESQAPRYILKSGACIRYDNGVGYISDAPIQNVGLNFGTFESVNRGKSVTIEFKGKITDDSYVAMSAAGYINDIKSPLLNMPNSDNNVSPIADNTTVTVEDYMLTSIGKTVIYEFEYTSVKENSIVNITSTLPDYLTYVRAYYTENESTVSQDLTTEDTTDLSFNIDSNDTIGTKYIIRILATINKEANNIKDNTISNTFNITETSKEPVEEEQPNTDNKSFTYYIVTFTVDTVPETLVNGSIFTYTLKYTSPSNTFKPVVTADLSRGLEYVPFSTKVVYQDGPTYTTIEPTSTDVTEEAGFIYTNPYSIAINAFHLYSAFYMMSVSENPYLHFEYINQKSNIQFISTNVNWNRPFLGFDKDTYNISITITQSVQEDLGLIPEDSDPLVKCIAVFYRDGEPYRYRTLDLVSMESDLYSFTFSKTFYAIDMLDNDNNIRVEDVQVPGQLETDAVETEYGYFNPTTELKIYALCALPDVDGAYTRYNLDAIVPGLDIDEDGHSWTVTNIYNVVNGVTFYHNYSEIMGSSVEPYGTTIEDEEGNTVMNTEGFIVKGVPVFGYDYSQSEVLIQNAIDVLNYRKAYIDNTLVLLENSFGIDFKFFNTYGPSKTYYIIRDTDKDNILDDAKEYIDKINLTLYFRVKLVMQQDSYTRNNITNDIKEYIEDLNDLGDLHIPNLVTQITNSYQEQITYFEYLGFNSYGPDIQHIYKDVDNVIDIHTPPEFLNVNNVKNPDNSLVPDINIYVSEM